jgi:hypothetical protein
MTKEEILDPPFKKYRDGDADFIPIQEFYSAMDKYAEQQATRFAEWIEDKGYSIANRNDGPIWSKGHDWPTDAYYTTELYALYLQSLQPDNR